VAALVVVAVAPNQQDLDLAAPEQHLQLLELPLLTLAAVVAVQTQTLAQEYLAVLAEAVLAPIKPLALTLEPQTQAVAVVAEFMFTTAVVIGITMAARAALE